MYDFESLDHYQILGIPRSATQEEMKKAYRREIARYHPDRYQSAGPQEQDYARARAARISEAYQALTNFASRTQYTSHPPRDEHALQEELATLYTQARSLLANGQPRDAAILLQRIQRADPFYRDSTSLAEQAEQLLNQTQMPEAEAASTAPRRGIILLGSAFTGVALLLTLWFLAGKPQDDSSILIGDRSAAGGQRTATADRPAPISQLGSLPTVTAAEAGQSQQARASQPSPTSKPAPTSQPSPSPEPSPTATSKPTATPEPTATTAPTATPAPAPTRVPPSPTAVKASADDLSGPVVFSDDFSRRRWPAASQSNWSLDYVDGRYHMTMISGVGTLWSYNDELAIPTDNVAISLNVEPRQGRAGLLFGFKDGSNYYRLVTGADGSYRLERRAGGPMQVLASGQGAGAGRLSLVLRGTSAHIYFGNTLLNQVRLPSAPGGAFGMALASNGAGEGYFDALTIRRAP